MKKNIFSETYLGLFHPSSDNIEYPYSILQIIGYDNNNFRSEKGREESIEIIDRLLDYNLINMVDFETSLTPSTQDSKTLVLNTIRTKWFVGADYPDFLSMPRLQFKTWYVEAIKKMGYKDDMNWKKFVSNMIGDFETWIIRNNPNEIL